MRRVGTGVTTLIAATAWMAAGAGAQTATVGQALAGGVPCNPGSQQIQQATASGVSYQAPSSGTITSWSHFGKTAPAGSGRLVVWRPTGNPNEFAVVGKSDPQAFVAEAINTFPASIPVSAGDYIGLRTETSAGCLVMGGAGDTYWHGPANQPDPPVGGAVVFPMLDSGLVANVSAAIQTAPPAAAPVRSTSISYKRDAFRGVVASSHAACLAAQVKVFRKKPGADKRIGKDATNRVGAWKVGERDADRGRYYASVAAAGECPAATSKSVKVK